MRCQLKIGGITAFTVSQAGYFFRYKLLIFQFTFYCNSILVVADQIKTSTTQQNAHFNPDIFERLTYRTAYKIIFKSRP